MVTAGGRKGGGTSHRDLLLGSYNRRDDAGLWWGRRNPDSHSGQPGQRPREPQTLFFSFVACPCLIWAWLLRNIGWL